MVLKTVKEEDSYSSNDDDVRWGKPSSVSKELKKFSEVKEESRVF